MRRVDQGTTFTLAGLAAGVRYRIAVQVVTSTCLSPYSRDQVVSTSPLQASDLQDLGNSLDLPPLVQKVEAIEYSSAFLETKNAGLETSKNENRGNIFTQKHAVLAWSSKLLCCLFLCNVLYFSSKKHHSFSSYYVGVSYVFILVREMSAGCAKLSGFHTDCLDDLQMMVENTATSIQESHSRLTGLQSGKCVDNTNSISTLCVSHEGDVLALSHPNTHTSQGLSPSEGRFL